MAQAPGSTGQEYWRPPNPNVSRLFEAPPAGAACWRCGIEYPPAARFCHMCGCSREPGVRAALPTNRPASLRLATRLLLRHLPLPLTSFVCFVLGVVCVVGAALLSAIYKTDTLIDWQAVQVWRIEWLLTGLAALIAGLLLKKVES